MRPNYTVIRCQTTDKFKVMDLLCDADEYELTRDHVDVVYYNGNDLQEKEETRKIVKENIDKLLANKIQADTKPNYVDEWFFIQLR